MRRDFFPDREADMVRWGETFARALEREVGHFGVRPVDVRAFADAQRAFARAFDEASTPSTRTPLAVARKADARRAMESLARALTRRLSHQSAVTGADRQRLGLAIPRPRVRHVGPPASAPLVRVVGVAGATVRIALIDADRPSRRARPDSAVGATVFAAVGPRPPADDAGWRYALSRSGTRAEIAFDPTLPPGTRVWIVAGWQSRRAERGPTSAPVDACLGEAACPVPPVPPLRFVAAA